MVSKPIRSVLAATDLQASSRRVVDIGASLARSADARLYLLHVIESKSVGHVPRDARELQLERRSSEAERALTMQTADLEASGVKAYGGHVVDRPAHEVILERIEGTEADVVVMGSHSREGRGHRLGSTADRIMRTAPVPNLIVRGEARMPVENVAVLTDFSTHARRAGRVAAEWLEVLGGGKARLSLLHVGNQLSLALEPNLEEWLGKEMEKEAGRLPRGDGAVDPTRRLCFGKDPVDAILEMVKEEGYDLLILGTKGHGPLRRALIGSVAMGLAQSAPCPVLVVPPRSRH